MTDESKTACNSEITEKSVSTIFEGRTITFCEQECLEEFNFDPEVFLESDHFLIDFDILPKLTTDNK